MGGKTRRCLERFIINSSEDGEKESSYFTTSVYITVLITVIIILTSPICTITEVIRYYYQPINYIHVWNTLIIAINLLFSSSVKVGNL